MIFFIKFIFGFVSILIGFSVHEFAHAAMAYRLGDPTQKYEGRLTLNPLVHIDWVGAAALMLSLILTGGRCIVGWGKPVAINAESLNDPIADGGVCSFAGPFANFLLALCAGLPVKFGLFAALPMVAYFLTVLASVNIALFIFNMIPFPPLDGWKFLQVFVPRDLAYKMRDWESSIGSTPMYIFMAVVVIFGPKFLGPIYMALLNMLVGQLPS
ncbi:MAG: site-2 protease family protein [Candidatus Bruticola sp.]